MPKPPKLSQADIDAFREAVKGVKPLANTTPLVRPAPARRRLVIRGDYPVDDLERMLDESAELPLVMGEEPISFYRPGIQNKTLRKLTKGQYNIGAILDLHGMTVEKAQHAVSSFLQRCIREEIRLALIIHGKGQHGQPPMLKNKLNYWLRNIDSVLAFCSATPYHGNRGALYVLLKQSKEENLA